MAQTVGAGVEAGQGLLRFGHEPFSIVAGGVQSHEFDIGGLVGFLVFTGGFAQGGGVGFAIEHVIDYLEGKAEFGGVVVEPRQGSIVQIGAA